MAKAGRPKKQLELVKDFDPSTWDVIPLGKVGTKIVGNELGFQMMAKGRKEKYSNKIKIKFGASLVERLGWKLDDKIDFFSDPNDKLQLAAMKRDTGRRLLQDINSVNCFFCCFPWYTSFKVLASKNTVKIDYTIHKSGYLIFRITPETEAVTEVSE
jgi:hypothetical protein